MVQHKQQRWQQLQQLPGPFHRHLLVADLQQWPAITLLPLQDTPSEA